MDNPNATEYHLGDNGHKDVEEESQDQLNTAAKNLQSLVRGDGSVTSMGKVELSLLQKMLTPLSDELKDVLFFRMCDFIDDEEAVDHVNAYYEAKDTGMDTSFNVALMFALCSANRRGGFQSNLIGVLTDTLQHAKWANTQKRTKEYDNYKSRSPIND